MKKRIWFIFATILATLNITFCNSKVSANNVSNTIQQKVEIEKSKNVPKWTTIINANKKHYKTLTVKNSFTGDQTTIKNSIKVEYGTVNKNGDFKAEKVVNNFKDYKVIGNNTTFNFKNVKSAIRITYNSQGQQTGTLSNTVSVLKNNDKPVQQTESINIKGTGNLIKTATASKATDEVKGNTAADAVITDSTGKVISHTEKLNKWVSYTVSYDWSIPNNMTIKNGDKIDFTLPSNVQVRQDVKFNVTEGTNGPVIGTFEIKKGSQTGTLTFNNYLAEHPQVDRHGTLSIETNGTLDNEPCLSWKMNKAGWVNSSNQPTWNIVVNPEGKHYSTLTIDDNLSDGQQLIPDSIIIQYGHWDKTTGQFIVDSQELNPSSLYKINGNQITFNFKDVDSAIQIVYNVKTDQSGILHNSATATADGLDTTINAQISYSGKGSMTGNIASSSSNISSSQESSLSSSSSVSSSSSSIAASSSSVVSNSSSSEVSSSNSSSSSKSEVSSSSSSMSSSSSSTTIPDTSYDFTNFTVTKKWDSNTHPSSITVKLLANGEETGKTATLSNSNNWKYTWKDLPAKDNNGKTIKYSAKEIVPDGYTPDYSDVTVDKTTTTLWLPADHWENGHKYIMTTSPNVGTVNALQDCGKNWQWNGHTINVSSNNTYPRFITDEEANKDNGSFIWTTELYKTGVKIDHLNGLHDVYTLVGNNGLIASLQGAQDMVEYSHRGQTNCQWFFGDYTGGENQPSVPEDDWSHVMGGANFYYPLTNGGTGDGNHKSIPLWYAYEQKTVPANDQSQTITNKLN